MLVLKEQRIRAHLDSDPSHYENPVYSLQHLYIEKPGQFQLLIRFMRPDLRSIFQLMVPAIATGTQPGLQRLPSSHMTNLVFQGLESYRQLDHTERTGNFPTSALKKVDPRGFSFSK